MTTVSPASEPQGLRPSHGRLARLAVGLSVLSGVAFVAAFATVAIFYAIGEEAAVEDTTLAVVLVSIMAAGLLGSVAAFMTGIVAAVKLTLRERWALLWLPLGVFPAIFLFIVLGEALWWE